MMSTRERWMVYPLLLLSVALALKANLDAVPSSGITDRVTCHELVVRSPEGRAMVHIGNAPENLASIRILTPSGEEAVLIGVGEDEITGQIEIRRGGQTQTQLGGDQEGGHLLLTAPAPEGVDPGQMAKTRLKLGHDADHRISGLMIVDPDVVPLVEVGDHASPWGFWVPWDLSWQATPAMKSAPPETKAPETKAPETKAPVGGTADDPRTEAAEEGANEEGAREEGAREEGAREEGAREEGANEPE